MNLPRNSILQLLALKVGLLCAIAAQANGGFNGIYAGTFTATSDDGAFAIFVTNDTQAKVFWFDTIDEDGGMVDFVIDADGSFQFTADGNIVNGDFVGSTVSGTYISSVPESGMFTGNRRPDNGPFRNQVGFYTGIVDGTFTVDGVPGFTDGPLYLMIDSTGAIGTFGIVDHVALNILIATDVLGGVLQLTQAGPGNATVDGLFGDDIAVNGMMNLQTNAIMGGYTFNRGFNFFGNGNWNAMQTIAAPPPRTTISQLVPLKDINNDGAADIAVPMQGGPGIDIFVRDGATGGIIASDGGFQNGAGSATQEIGVANADILFSAAVPDVNSNEKVAVLSNEPNGNFRARLYDPLSGSPNMPISSMTFPLAYVPVAMAVVPDIDLTNTPALVVLGVRNDGDVKARVRNAITGVNIGSVSFAPNFPPQFIAVVPDITGNGIAELAVLGIDAQGNIRVQLKDAATGALIHWIQFARAFVPHAMVVIPDATAGPAIAVLGEHQDGRISAQVKDANTRQNIIQGRVNFSPSYPFAAMTTIEDLTGNGVSELVYLGINAAGNVRAQLKDPETKQLVKQLFYSKSFPPDGVAGFQDIDGNGQPELGVLGTNTNNGNVRLQIRDGQSGNETLVLFIP